MSIKYFGQYLIENGYISHSELVAAIQYQKNKNLKIGIFVIDRKLMTPEQVEITLNIQRTQDIPFGEAAINKGFLSKDQLDVLLLDQKDERVYLGDALIEKGILNPKDLAKHLEKFNIDQQEEIDKVNSGFENIVPKYQDIVQNSVLITKKMISRLLGEYSKISGCYEMVAGNSIRNDNRNDYIIYQEVFCDVNLIIAFCMSKETMLFFSSQMLKKKLTIVDACVKDTVEEFLNIVVGHFCVFLSKHQIANTTAPPVCKSCYDHINLVDLKYNYLINMLVGEKEFDIQFMIS